MAKKPPRASRRVFSAFSEISYSKLKRGFDAAKSIGIETLIFVGAWTPQRRFAIDDIKLSKYSVTEPVSNPINFTLAIPLHAPEKDVIAACRSFGGQVERLCRDTARGQFDRVVSADDGAVHLVHKYHHVSLCGHNSGGWLGGVDSLAKNHPGVDTACVFECSACVVVSITKPAHRARYHPLSGIE